MKEQSKNRRGCHYITHNGETKILSEWARTLGINRHTLKSRLISGNYTVEEALNSPINHKLARVKNKNMPFKKGEE
jgi:hypothetical protein